ncbi:outer membrane biosynthesis protein TonB [Actinopolyspora biskrensis]|uniref:Outer membrane biosynthesis protein TonB n=1 Tax=Actinopolyspora biskrensis TaxID=1470178 RepID=A0A852Z2K0_9ACTN|nr:outer membrane biosynthesis protein TonB [Actinopolyspora biskrensis]
MGKKTYLAGSVAATAGLLLAGTPSFADSADNDGINVGNGNNASVAPIQLCGNDIAVLGAVASVLSPESAECVNAPVVDHPSTGGDKPDEPKEPEKPDEPDKPDKPDEPEKPDKPDKPEKPGEPDEPKQPEKPQHPGDEDEEELPSAPTPVSPEGHAAVTG